MRTPDRLTVFSRVRSAYDGRSVGGGVCDGEPVYRRAVARCSGALRHEIRKVQSEQCCFQGDDCWKGFRSWWFKRKKNANQMQTASINFLENNYLPKLANVCKKGGLIDTNEYYCDIVRLMIPPFSTFTKLPL